MTSSAVVPSVREMRLYPVQVARAVAISPHLRRVTVTGAELTGFPFAGPDQRVKLMLPHPGEDILRFDGATTIPEFLALPVDTRPIMRTYTVRHHRPAAAELDIDFALHGDPAHAGPASRWATTARPGDPAALYGPAASYAPPADTQWQLIAGDESALPAVAAILERRPDRVAAQALIEVPDTDDRQPLGRCGTIVSWFSRDGEPAHESRRLLDAVRDLTLPAGPGYVWLAGESGVVTALRRHLVNDRGLDRDRITFTGYWRHGHAEN